MHCRGGRISRAVEAMGDKDLRQIENQIRPHGRKKEARRPFGGMVIVYVETVVNNVEPLKNRQNWKEAGARYFRRIGMPNLCWGENRSCVYVGRTRVLQPTNPSPANKKGVRPESRELAGEGPPYPITIIVQ